MIGIQIYVGDHNFLAVSGFPHLSIFDQRNCSAVVPDNRKE